MTAVETIAVTAEDTLRADLYNFLGLALSSPPDQALLDQMIALSGDGSDIGKAVNMLAQIAKGTDPMKVESEFNSLFIGLGRGELLPYASYYLTGFLNEKPLANLRADMAKRGLQRSQNIHEPEDHIASLMEMMASMIVGRFGPATDLSHQKVFFDSHISAWAGHFFSDLEAAQNAVLYTAIGRLGKAFIAVEREAFRLSAG